jgi:catechol 2,3-dioxygenase-like lactoylglutathione lyase family enzyme
MRARLDHIGIAVANLDDALAFYRDALGLEIDPPEDVQSQRVRAHFIPLGDAALELLEATADDSPIAKFLNRRGRAAPLNRNARALSERNAWRAAHRPASARRAWLTRHVHPPVEC